ncbi:hypothetical protein Dvina_16115 [Dactylosporangium vinaceum]|uniref:Uncharacterized protein n=1 Tax=Dactylosporangium vinaceum TaxID=53362 RepID=A0ABV5M939_9ACTN|nr:hypothetical protein [Dactylosporangium vinaceum]UAB99460.1 hypothetical protein Dvina_16115 [Dactylosporangium vinaceum]
MKSRPLATPSSRIEHDNPQPQTKLEREVVSLVGVLEASAVFDGHCHIELCTDDRRAAAQIHYPAALTAAVHAAICERVTLRGTVQPSPSGALQMHLVSLAILSHRRAAEQTWSSEGSRQE